MVTYRWINGTSFASLMIRSFLTELFFLHYIHSHYNNHHLTSIIYW